MNPVLKQQPHFISSETISFFDRNEKLVKEIDYLTNNHIKFIGRNFKSIERDICSSIDILSLYSLKSSVKWASELLISYSGDLHSTAKGKSAFNNNVELRGDNLVINKGLLHQFNNSEYNSKIELNESIETDGENIEERNKKLEISEVDELHSIHYVFQYAKSLFELKEYRKCMSILRPYANIRYQRAWFLYLECELIVIELLREDGKECIDDILKLTTTKSKPLNKEFIAELNSLVTEISPYESQLNPFMTYMYAIILKNLNNLDKSKQLLIRCLNSFPIFWSAWVELVNLNKPSDFETLFVELNDTWVKYFYFSNFLIVHGYEEQGIKVSQTLLSIFPQSFHLMNSLAYGYYTSSNYNKSKEEFEKLLNIDPHRYENLDSYSNILYISHDLKALSDLAEKIINQEIFRYEYSCALANLFALKGDHVRSVKHLQRAISLEPNNSQIWILMGHEYLEMKEINLSIQCYRKSLDINPRDYRAWYALGLIYELHSINHFTLYYYSMAVKNKPNDFRMWTALASNYEKLDKLKEAIVCYSKALELGDSDGNSILKLGKLHEELKENLKAVYFYEEVVNQYPASKLPLENIQEVCLYLSQYYFSIDKIKAWKFIKEVLTSTESEDFYGSKKVNDLVSSLLKFKEVQAYLNGKPIN